MSLARHSNSFGIGWIRTCQDKSPLTCPKPNEKRSYTAYWTLTFLALICTGSTQASWLGVRWNLKHVYCTCQMDPTWLFKKKNEMELSLQLDWRKKECTYSVHLFLVLQAEVHYLGELSHPNLVKLIGFCCENEHRLLVYEYMPRGSLEKQLFRRKWSNLDLKIDLFFLSLFE